MVKLHTGFKIVSSMYNWGKCAVDVWFPVSLCVADVLLNPGHTVPGTGCSVRSVCAFYRCQFWWAQCHQYQPCSFQNPSEAKLRLWVTEDCSCAAIHWMVGNCCQSSDSFSALATLLLDNRVANARTQWDFPFQAWRWKMLKKLCSYAVSAFNTTFSVVLWPFINTRSILGEVRTNPQSFHGKENSSVVCYMIK